MTSSKLKYFSSNSKKGDRASELSLVLGPNWPLVRECGPRSGHHVSSTKRTCEFRRIKSFNNILFIYLFILNF